MERLGALGVRQDDVPEERLRKRILTLAALAITAASTVWVTTYYAYGLVLAGSIPLAYQILSLLGLAAFARTKRFDLFRDVQLSLMLALPFLLQWSLGGFVASGAVALWALVSPLGALVLAGARTSAAWFAAFAGLVAVSPAVQQAIPAGGAPPATARTAFFVLNILGTTGVSFLVLQYFVRERDREHARSERLLLNILPAPVADRLKAGADVIADACDEVSVVFVDLVGFTPQAARMAPHDVVALLNEVFTVFDGLAETRGLEKIKTIGDGYMAAAGILGIRSDHACAAADFALDAVEAVARLAAARERGLDVRVGIASGPLVAGVIGRTKFGYDLWGDTVNTASRMESAAPVGTIQLTEETATRLGEGYVLERRDAVDVRGKGTMTTYLLRGRG